MHGVRPRERARVVGELDDPMDIRQRSDGVRGDGERDDSGAIAELPLEFGDVQSRVAFDVREPHFEPFVVRELEPG